MEKLNRTTIKIASWDFAVFCFFLFMWSRGAAIFNYMDPRINPIGTCLYLLSILYLSKKTVNATTPLYGKLFIAIVCIWVLYHAWADYNFQLVPYVTFVLNIYAGLKIVQYYGYSIVEYYDRALYPLAVISLFGWGLTWFLGGEFMLKIPHLEGVFGRESGSIIVYTVENLMRDYFFLGLPRNPGFAWEAGMYATLLNIAIVFRIMILRGTLSFKDRHIQIYLLALLTTTSTTGFVAFLVFVGIHLLWSPKINVGKKIAALLFLSIIFSYAMTLPFMYEKILNAQDQDNFLSSAGHSWIEHDDNLHCADRIEGIMLDWLNVQEKPLLGYGLARNNSYVYNNISQMITISDGILGPSANMGIPFGILLLILLYYSSKRFGDHFSYSVPFALFFVVLLTSVSYNYFYNPLMRAIALLCILIPKRKMYENNSCHNIV